jgi:hypothetical protein
VKRGDWFVLAVCIVGVGTIVALWAVLLITHP